MQALIDRANQSGHYLPQDQNQCWEWRSFSPPKEQHLAHTQPQQTADDDSTYPFQYKTWLRKQTAAVVEIDTDSNGKENSSRIDTLIPLDLSQFDRTKYTTNNNGLSVDDIRGAVGGSESIPGLSSSSTTETTTTTNPATTVTETDVVTTTVETPAAETPSAETRSDEMPITTVETPSEETQAGETPAPTVETPVEEAPIEETPTVASPSVESTKEASVSDPVPESNDIEMKD